jgi:hypothetical protein
VRNRDQHMDQSDSESVSDIFFLRQYVPMRYNSLRSMALTDRTSLRAMKMKFPKGFYHHHYHYHFPTREDKSSGMIRRC